MTGNSRTGANSESENQASTFTQLYVVAEQEFRLSLRNRWGFALTGLITLLAGVIVVFSGSKVGPSSLQVLLVSLSSLATYLLPMAALLFGYDAIVGAAEEGWLDVVFALPVRRASVVTGTFLGRAVTVMGATTIGFGSAAVLLLVLYGVLQIGPYALFIVSAVLFGLGFLSLSLLISTVSPEKTHALGVSLIVWLWFVLIHDMVALGVIATFKLPPKVLSVLVLANPADIFRVLVLQTVNAQGGGFAAVFAGTSLSVSLLFVAQVVWIVVPIVLAGYLIQSRSL